MLPVAVLLVTPVVDPFVLWLGVLLVASTVLTLVVPAPAILLTAADSMVPSPFVARHHIG